MNDDPFISVVDAALLFEVTPKTLYGWIAKGLLKGKVRIRTMPNGVQKLSENDIHTHLKESIR